MDGTRPQARWYFNISTRAILAFIVHLNKTSPDLRLGEVTTKKTQLASQLVYLDSLVPHPASGRVRYELQKPS